MTCNIVTDLMQKQIGKSSCLLLSQTLKEICKNAQQCYFMPYFFFFWKYSYFYPSMLFMLASYGFLDIELTNIFKIPQF